MIMQNFEIHSNSYSLMVDVLPDEIIKTQHSHTYRNSIQIDVYASNRCLAFADLEEKICRLRSGDNWINLEGSIAIFIPPFSIVEWEVEKNKKYHWTCLMSTCEIPIEIKNHPVLLFQSIKCPTNILDVFKTINNLTKNGIPLVEKKPSSAIAIKAKKYLDSHFREKVMITEVAKNLKISRVVLSRAFTLNYGISLTDYRHRLRLFEALSLINKGTSITEATVSVGFSDSSQFNFHFKKYFSTQPKAFDVNKRNRARAFKSCFCFLS